MSGKVDYGEQVTKAAKRELYEETNLHGEPKIIALKHYCVFDKNTKELVEDKFMFLSIIENPTGKLTQSDEGKYEWVKRSELKSYLTNPFESWESFEIQLKYIETYKEGYNTIQFIEEEHYTEKF